MSSAFVLSLCAVCVCVVWANCKHDVGQTLVSTIIANLIRSRSCVTRIRMFSFKQFFFCFSFVVVLVYLVRDGNNQVSKDDSYMRRIFTEMVSSIHPWSDRRMSQFKMNAKLARHSQLVSQPVWSLNFNVSRLFIFGRVWDATRTRTASTKRRRCESDAHTPGHSLACYRCKAII